MEQRVAPVLDSLCHCSPAALGRLQSRATSEHGSPISSLPFLCSHSRWPRHKGEQSLAWGMKLVESRGGQPGGCLLRIANCRDEDKDTGGRCPMGGGLVVAPQRLSQRGGRGALGNAPVSS